MPRMSATPQPTRIVGGERSSDISDRNYYQSKEVSQAIKTESSPSYVQPIIDIKRTEKATGKITNIGGGGGYVEPSKATDSKIELIPQPQAASSGTMAMYSAAPSRGAAFMEYVQPSWSNPFLTAQRTISYGGEKIKGYLATGTYSPLKSDYGRAKSVGVLAGDILPSVAVYSSPIGNVYAIGTGAETIFTPKGRSGIESAAKFSSEFEGGSYLGTKALYYGSAAASLGLGAIGLKSQIQSAPIKIKDVKAVSTGFRTVGTEEQGFILGKSDIQVKATKLGIPRKYEYQVFSATPYKQVNENIVISKGSFVSAGFEESPGLLKVAAPKYVSTSKGYTLGATKQLTNPNQFFSESIGSARVKIGDKITTQGFKTQAVTFKGTPSGEVDRYFSMGRVSAPKSSKFNVYSELSAIRNVGEQPSSFNGRSQGLGYKVIPSLETSSKGLAIASTKAMQLPSSKMFAPSLIPQVKTTQVTKSIQIQSPIQMPKTAQRTSNIQFPVIKSKDYPISGVKQPQLPRMGQSEIVTPIQKQPQLQSPITMPMLKQPSASKSTGINPPSNIPTFPFEKFPLIGLPKFGSFDFGSLGKGYKSRKQLTKYTPSYTSFLFGTKGKATKTFTGFESRPIPKGFTWRLK